MLDPLEFGGAFIITVAGILIVLLIAALFSLAERGGVSWLVTDHNERADRGQGEARRGQDLDEAI